MQVTVLLCIPYKWSTSQQHVHVHRSPNVHVCYTHAHTLHTHTHPHTHTHMHASTHTHTCTHIPHPLTRTHACTHKQASMHTHAHTTDTYLKAILSDGKHHFYHVLYSHIQLAIVQYGSQTIIHTWNVTNSNTRISVLLWNNQILFQLKYFN